MKLLHIEVSPKADKSASRAVSNHLVERLKRSQTETTVVRRDLAARPLPHVNGSMVEAYFTPPSARTPQQRRALQVSDELVDELLAVDAIVISTPMWNFSMPSVLKAWIDHVIRAGRTFSFSHEGLKGLVSGKKVYLVLSSGSVFSQGPFAPLDQLTPALKSALGFIGLHDVEIIRVEGTNDPQTSLQAIENAKLVVEKLVS